jgi:hypothetical protein
MLVNISTSFPLIIEPYSDQALDFLIKFLEINSDVMQTMTAQINIRQANTLDSCQRVKIATEKAKE